MALQDTNIKQFPPITKPMALEIAKQACKENNEEFSFHSKQPERFAHPYGVNLDEPCWYVYAPWGDGLLALRSSRVIIISRRDGQILYDGPAGDEG